MSVVVSAFSMERWEYLCASVASLESQTAIPKEILVVIDGPPLLDAAAERWADGADRMPPVFVLRNEAGRGLGGARNTGVRRAKGDVVAFLDDDATADPWWLERMVAPYADAAVVGVGGAPQARLDGERPSWWPIEFDWVVGCAYRGLPTHATDMGHMIGAAMSGRRWAIDAVGGFHADALDDFDLSLRLANVIPGGRVVFEPTATVQHRVPASRLTWGYFWRRCYLENRRKALVLHELEGGSLGAERRYLTRVIPSALVVAIREGIVGAGGGFRRAAAMSAGVILAGLGYLHGLFDAVRGAPKS